MRFSMLIALLILVKGGSGQAPPTIDGYTYKTVKMEHHEQQEEKYEKDRGQEIIISDLDFEDDNYD